MKLVVSDASPVHYLVLIGAVDILPKLFSKVIIPEHVISREICHGVLVLARSIDPETGRSVLYGHKTTALTWKLENAGDAIANITRFWDRHYYRTYRDPPGKPAGFMSVQQEVTRALASADDFVDVPSSDPEFKRRTSGTVRDSETDLSAGFVVRDGGYISARWPGDAHVFAHAFAGLL